jgi:Uma2 family endonuclease
MAIVEQQIEPLRPGDYLCRDEFLHRWEAMPELKRAELIGGIVYMPSPLSVAHGQMTSWVNGWLLLYAVHTPGCAVGNATTWLMRKDAPQPDVHLRILPEFGGHSQPSGSLVEGAPELAAEVCLSSTSYDLHQKKSLYESADVNEYVTVLLSEKEVRWHWLVSGSYQLLAPTPDGTLQSVIFPGLWLNVPALLKGDMLQVLESLNEGLRSFEHAAFVSRLAAQRRGGQAGTVQ